MEPSVLAFLKLGMIFGIFLIALKLKIDLWITILGGCVVVYFLTPVTIGELLSTVANVPKDRGFTALASMLFLILILSGVQAATGQNKRLVLALESILKWPRIRLVIFPALVGLLPMPGGALFSCPMLEDAAHGINISPRRKSLINYWFRHIWETAWPLYPGYILLCSLLDIPLTKLMLYNFPFVIITFTVGWFLILRTSEAGEPAAVIEKQENINYSATVKTIIYEGLPLLITFFGALAVSILMDVLEIKFSSQLSFVISVPIAIIISYAQGKSELKTSIFKIIFNYNMLKVMLLVFAIYCFKDVIGISGIVDDISTGEKSRIGTYALFIILPFICGLLTGIMVGYIGTAFPILISLAHHMNMQEEFLLFIMLGLIAGNAGQLLTPLHVCMVVTVNYFKASIVSVIRSLFIPVAVYCVFATLWAVLFYLLGGRLF